MRWWIRGSTERRTVPTIELTANTAIHAASGQTAEAWGSLFATEISASRTGPNRLGSAIQATFSITTRPRASAIPHRYVLKRSGRRIVVAVDRSDGPSPPAGPGRMISPPAPLRGTFPYRSEEH